MFIQPRSEEDHKNLIEQGFTLVELLIVVVILGILAGIVVFAVGNLTDTAKTNACATEASTFVTAYNASKANNKGTAPVGTTTSALVTVLTGSSGGGPYLQSTPTYGADDPAAIPAGKWAWDDATKNVKYGTGCTVS